MLIAGRLSTWEVMKKTHFPTKLRLATTTVQPLSAPQLHQVVGGATYAGGTCKPFPKTKC